MFEHIHSKKRNRLEHQKLNDLVYVRYNLRLQQRKKLKNQNYDPISLETLDDHSDWILEESPPYLTTEEVESLRNELANMDLHPVSDDIGNINFDEEDGPEDHIILDEENDAEDRANNIPMNNVADEHQSSHDLPFGSWE